MSADYLDLTIYKGPHFKKTHKLDLKTYQKPYNLYQYLEFSSAHPRKTYQSIVLGECVRYVRSNTRPETFVAVINAFQKRLQQRRYPNKLTRKWISRIKFINRENYLNGRTVRKQALAIPLFKCHPPPRFDCLKTVILQHYGKISHLVPQPRFVSLALPNLQKSLIRAEVKPTVEQVFDILWQLKNSSQNTSHKFAGTLPKLRKLPPLVKPCNNIRCNTCKHLNCSATFTSSITNQSYPIRYTATCSSLNLIYLITCTKCKKQYVGLTTKQLNVRINHHRSNIFQNKTIYLCIHFNFPDHGINHLSVQVIDKVPKNTH